MKTHRTTYVTAASADLARFDTELRRLCRQTPAWRVLSKESKDYTIHADRPSYLIAFVGDEKLPAASIALSLNGYRKRPQFDSPNIVPRDLSQLSREEYNGLAVRFMRDLTSTIGYRDSGIRIRVSSDQMDLKTIIPGKQCRQFFTQYLNGNPLTYHGLDLKRLDLFICAVHRYHAEVSPDNLAGYLIGDRGWKEVDAKWVRDRVRAGLELLRVNAQF
jgi:hypothetical protein